MDSWIYISQHQDVQLTKELESVFLSNAAVPLMITYEDSRSVVEMFLPVNFPLPSN